MSDDMSTEVSASIAQKRIQAFVRRFGQAYLPFACHAAFPLALTPDLLYRLWAVFPKDIANTAIRVPWIAVADLLLSDLCEYVGYDLYEMDPAVREFLLLRLESDERLGEQRILELAEFLLLYSELALRTLDQDKHSLAQAQQILALVYRDPDQGILMLAQAFARIELSDTIELARIVQLIESVARRIQLSPLVTYARGIGCYLKGDIIGATAFFEQLPAEGDTTDICGLTLHIPIPLTSNSTRPNIVKGSTDAEDGPELLQAHTKTFDLKGHSEDRKLVRGIQQYGRGRIWTRETILAAIRAEAKNGHALNYSSIQERVPSLLRAAERVFGSWGMAVEAAGFDYSSIRRYRLWTRDSVIERIRWWFEKGEDLSWRNVVKVLDPPLAAAALSAHRFTSWDEALQAAGIELTQSGTYRRTQADPDESDSDLTMEELLKQELGFRGIKTGEIIIGTVESIDEHGALVDLGGQSLGIVPPEELGARGTEPINVGDEIAVYVVDNGSRDGNIILSKKKADYEKAWNDIIKAYEDNETLSAMVIDRVKGGLVIDLGMRGFLPASHVATKNVDSLDRFVGQTIRLKVIEVDRNRKRVVVSQKQAVEEEKMIRREQTVAHLEEGQIRRGVVRRVTDYGAFVDLGGIDGLLHVTEMSWGRVNHPSDIVKPGQKIDVMVLKYDVESEKISLGLKQILPDPWQHIDEFYSVGDEVEGTVTRLVPFGAFVALDHGIEGIIPISELADHRINKPDDVVTMNQHVYVKIINIRPSERRMTLSLRLQEQSDDESAQNANRTQHRGLTIGEMLGDVFSYASDDEQDKGGSQS